MSCIALTTFGVVADADESWKKEAALSLLVARL